MTGKKIQMANWAKSHASASPEHVTCESSGARLGCCAEKRDFGNRKI